MGRDEKGISKGCEFRQYILILLTPAAVNPTLKKVLTYDLSMGRKELIFVTVGTHEQQFNRLVKKVDELKRDGVITEDVVMQTGFSTYEPKNCRWQKLFPFQDMGKYIEQARIVITHGGPSSFIMPLQIGKIPIVVPRQSKFNEHVNDHQVLFARAVKERYGNLIVVEDIDKLSDAIKDYNKIVTGMYAGSEINNNEKFCNNVEKIAEKLVGEEKKR